MTRSTAMLLVLAAAFPPAARAGTINFDDVPGGLPPVALPANYGSPQATFSTEAGAQLLVFSGAGTVGTSAPNNLTAGFDPANFPYDADLYVDFSPPANDLTFRIAADNSTGVIAGVRVFHGGGSLATLDVVGNGNLADPILMDLTAYQNVIRLEVVNITDEFGLSYDDFLVAPIPEPTSAVLALGMWFVVARMGRRCARERQQDEPQRSSAGVV
jgi:hypothetical protein